MNRKAIFSPLLAQVACRSPRLVALLLVLALFCPPDAGAAPVAQLKRGDAFPHAVAKRYERPIVNAQVDASENSKPKALDAEEQGQAVLRLKEILSTEEIPNLRIGWHINDSFGAHTLAQEQNKPTVIVFHSPYCGFCYNLLAKMACPQVSRFAGRMVFGVSIDEMDLGAQQLSIGLGVVRLPTMVILEPKPDRIHVLGRIEGEVSPDDVERIFLEAVKDFDGFDKSLLLSTADVEALSKSRGISMPEICRKGSKAQ